MASPVFAGELLAGVGRVDITDREAGPVNDPLFAKVLVLKKDGAVAVLITLDVVAVGEIGRIGNGFLPGVRAALEKELGIPPESVLINASHCHGVPRGDTQELTVEAVKAAWASLVPVKAGAGEGREGRISENRRLKLKDGSEADMRRAYPMPRDEDLAEIGLIDPRIGLLRIDRLDGRPLAAVYHFACHPIMNPPSKGNSADFPGYASRVIEENLGEGCVAFFLQGCGGDINPLRYKEPRQVPDAEPLGHRLGLSALEGLRKITTSPQAELRIDRAGLILPRSSDAERRIAAIEAEQARLLASLKPTTLNFKSFLPLLIEQKMSPENPSHYAQSYRHDEATDGREALKKMDGDNRTNVEAYLHNIEVMERLGRLNTNLALLRRHLAKSEGAGAELEVEIGALRIGDFRLATFPGELTVGVGLGIQKALGEPNVYVSGYTNGYIYYAATARQRSNTGYAQEDCDVMVAPEWQGVYEKKALEMLRALRR